MTRAKAFIAAGEALYGREWKRPLSRALKINERTLYRIQEAVNNGEDYRLSDGVIADLRALVSQNAATLNEVLQALN